jgi:hypothetical protein
VGIGTILSKSWLWVLDQKWESNAVFIVLSLVPLRLMMTDDHCGGSVLWVPVLDLSLLLGLSCSATVAGVKISF